MKMTVEFCAIDAKDDALCGYKPVAFTGDGERLESLGPANGHLLIMMNREYLTRLASLQAEIKEKYESLAIADEEPVPRQGPYTKGIATEGEWFAARKLAMELFPGDEAHYYT